VYHRYSFRPTHSAELVRCIDLALVELPEEERSKGHLTRYLEELEGLCGYPSDIEGVYVESVMETRLAAFFAHRPGYTRRLTPLDPNNAFTAPSYLFLA
jgi:hypothetical protein